MQYVVGKSGVLSLGRQGEHLARRLLFTEPADWERELGPGSVQALVQPPGGGAAYPVSLERTEEGWKVDLKRYGWANTLEDAVFGLPE